MASIEIQVREVAPRGWEVVEIIHKHSASPTKITTRLADGLKRKEAMMFADRLRKLLQIEEEEKKR